MAMFVVKCRSDGCAGFDELIEAYGIINQQRGMVAWVCVVWSGNIWLKREGKEMSKDLFVKKNL